jgi:hypothetical protein
MGKKERSELMGVVERMHALHCLHLYTHVH